MSLIFEQVNAIYTLNSSVVVLRGDVAYDADGNEVTYDKSAVDAEVARTAYIGKRQAEYPSYADQFDKIFHEGIDAWKAEIQAVKDKYPKGEQA
jgi:hypothetical protein